MHFAPGECMQCNQQLIVISDSIYHLELTIRCEQKEVPDWSTSAPSTCTEHALATVKTEPGALDEEEQKDILPSSLFTDESRSIDNQSEASFEPIPPVTIAIERPIAEPQPKHVADVKHPDDFTWPAYPDDSESDAESPQPHLEPETKKKRPYQRKKPKHECAKRGPKVKSTQSRTYECYICRKKFKYVPQVVRHLRAHYEGGPTCEICHKVFADEYNLKTHRRLHTDQKRFICSYCGKGFHQRNNFVCHLTTHTKERNHKCDVCGKTFARRTNLTQHQRVHSGHKPCKCHIEGCDRAYMFKVDLKRHLYGAHGIYTKKYECTVCGKVLPENKLLVAHMQTHK